MMSRERSPELEAFTAKVGAWVLAGVAFLLVAGVLLAAWARPLWKAPGIGMQWGVVGVRILHAYSHALDTSDPRLDMAAHGVTGGIDSISVQFRNCLASATFACWEQAFIASAGSVPKWFDAFKQAFDAGMRRTGKCQEGPRE
jgi:hypothetical protein